MALETTNEKLRVVRTNKFQNKTTTERQQFAEDTLIFDTSGGIYVGNGKNKEPLLVAGGISMEDATNGVVDDPDINLTSVKFVAQTLTDAQKAQARLNIGAGSEVIWEYY